MNTVKEITAFSSEKKKMFDKPEFVYVTENYEGVNFSFSKKIDSKIDPTKKLIGKVEVHNSEAFSNEDELNQYTKLLAQKAWESGKAEYISA